MDSIADDFIYRTLGKYRQDMEAARIKVERACRINSENPYIVVHKRGDYESIKSLRFSTERYEVKKAVSIKLTEPATDVVVLKWDLTDKVWRHINDESN